LSQENYKKSKFINMYWDN